MIHGEDFHSSKFQFYSTADDPRVVHFKLSLSHLSNSHFPQVKTRPGGGLKTLTVSQHASAQL